MREGERKGGQVGRQTGSTAIRVGHLLAREFPDTVTERENNKHRETHFYAL